MSSSKLWMVFGATFVAAAAYCVYFDQKRRSAPDYKQKLREKRLKQREEREAKAKAAAAGGSTRRVLTSHEEVKAFFIESMSEGQNQLAEGNVAKAVEHFANAVRVHSDPPQLLRVLKDNLPAEAFMLLLRTLQATARQ